MDYKTMKVPEDVWRSIKVNAAREGVTMIKYLRRVFVPRHDVKIREVEVGLFEAKCAKYPDIAEFGETYAEAMELMIDAIETTERVLTEKECEK